MRKAVVMEYFDESTGEESVGVGTVSVKRGKVRIIYGKRRIYWEQDETEGWLLGDTKTECEKD